MKERMTCRDVAELYGVTEHTVSDWIRKKKLGAVKASKSYVIRIKDIERFEEENATIKD